MNPVLAATLVLALLTLGEVLSVLTRARVPGFLVAFVTLFALTSLHVLPHHLVADSTLTTTGNLLAPALMVHMGTMIPLRVMRQQYRAVLIGVCGMLGAALLVTAVVTPLFGYAAAVAGVGPINGGLLAYLITDKALHQVGLTSLTAVPLLVFALQQLVGLPLVTNLLRRHAAHITALARQPRQPVPVTPDGLPAAASPPQEPDDLPPARRKLLVPERYAQSNTALLLLVFTGGACAVGLQSLTHISYSVWGLGIGVLGPWLGVYPEKALEKANGFTVAMIGLLVVALASATTISTGQLFRVLPVVASIVLVGVAGLMLGGWVGARLVGWRPVKGMAVALTALLGFPLDYLTTTEVARSVGGDEHERKAITDDLLAPMLTGGFTTVSIGSVVIASLLVRTL
ncbi:hypothetical protein [Streptomyces sp. NPDC102360]|uniref:hypothetical protein n=1 Tax=Streptomyces sp. NPDC102360 TaxID=3366160 RepID=UPI00382E63C1